jgi:archaellum biogenesis protein FlaJ (TadC family)
MNTILLIIMTVFNISSIIVRLVAGDPLSNLIFWAALFLWGLCAGLWLQTNLF